VQSEEAQHRNLLCPLPGKTQIATFKKRCFPKTAVEQPAENKSQGKPDVRCGAKDCRILSVTAPCSVKSFFICIIKWYDLPSNRRSGSCGGDGYLPLTSYCFLLKWHQTCAKSSCRNILGKNVKAERRYILLNMSVRELGGKSGSSYEKKKDKRDEEGLKEAQPQMCYLLCFSSYCLYVDDLS